MITKFKQSWELFKASIAVTVQHPKLLWFPFLTTLFTGIVALFFISAMALPIVLANRGQLVSHIESAAATSPDTSQANQQVAPSASGHSENFYIGHSNHAKDSTTWRLGWLIGLPLYFVSMFMATFFNVAFYNEIISALNGRGVSLRRGLAVARNRLPSILAWSALAGLVGWLIRTVEQRLPLAARIVTGLIGMAWSIAAVFAIPVIIQEQSQRNPLKILQQSAKTLRRAWGEGLIGYIGFSVVGLAVFMCSLLPLLVAGALAWFFNSVWTIAIVGILWALGLLLVAYVSGVAAHVYRCALYLYAAEGVVPLPYSQDLLDKAWRIKKS